MRRLGKARYNASVAVGSDDWEGMQHKYGRGRVVGGIAADALKAAQRVLVVEDVYIVAQHLIDLLEEEGFEPVGPAPSVANALALVQSERLDAAVVDMRLADGELAAGVCEALQAKGIPYLLLTGWHVAREPRVPIIVKPFERQELFAALRSILGRA